MDVLETIAWSLIAATATWGLAASRTAAALARARAEMRAELRHWQNDAARARTRAEQLEREMASWAAGCKQGREDVVSILPLLVARQRSADSDASEAVGQQ
jgi:chromosome segregation ATPase